MIDSEFKNKLKLAKENDYILFSDPDEIPRPSELVNLNLDSKYGIFLQDCFCYKLNIYNQYESPWEGTRICKKKHLKNFTHLRKKIRCKNITKSFEINFFISNWCPFFRFRISLYYK